MIYFFKYKNYIKYMLDSLNKKWCKENQKLKCNTLTSQSSELKKIIFIIVTLAARYLFPYFIGAYYFNSIVGIIYIFYPFSQIIPYYHIYFEYIPYANLQYTTLDFILLIGSISIMLGYYFYVFTQYGSYVFIQIFFSVFISLGMVFIATSVIFGIVFLIFNVFFTILIDISLIKKTKLL